MRVKKFEAKTMKEALRMVKQELGPEAVILSARDNRKSHGLVGEGSVEVTAAISERTLQKKHFVESRMRDSDRVRFNDASATAQKRVIDTAVERRLEQRARAERSQRPITSTNYVDIPEFEGRAPQVRTQPQEQRLARAVAKEPEAESVQQGPRSELALGHIRTAAREAWNSGLMADDEQAQKTKMKGAISRLFSGALGREEVDFVTKAPRVSEDDDQFSIVPLGRVAMPSTAPATHEISALKAEIHRLQDMIGGIQRSANGGTIGNLHPGADYGVPYDLSDMFRKLTDAGVGAENAAEIMQACQRDMDPIKIKKRPLVDAWVARFILHGTEIVGDAYRGRVHLFMGGAGSGKTSTLVKMASHLVVNEKRRVAILTADAQKVGAIDQLKIFAQILNVPLAVVRDAEEWEWALRQLHGYDSILVDYPGLQLRELNEIDLLKLLLPPEEVKATRHLVVNATAKDCDAFEIERRYRIANCDDLIVTNVDQSAERGLLWNLQRKSKLPFHSFGIGSRLPEDFEVASKERVLDLIFKLSAFKIPNRQAV